MGNIGLFHWMPRWNLAGLDRHRFVNIKESHPVSYDGQYGDQQDPGNYDPTQPEGRPLGASIVILLLCLATMGIGWAVIAFVVT